jgi:hypothetical protein
MASNKIYEVKCPSCGAPLHMTGERITCNYCGAALERERPADPEPTPFATPPEPQVIVIQSEYTTITARRKSGSSSCWSCLFTLLLIGGIVGAVGWFQFGNQLAAISSLSDVPTVLANFSQLPGKLANSVSISSLSRLILLPDSNDSSPDFLTYIYKHDAETYALTYVEAPSSTIRWQSLPLKEWYAAQVLQSPATLYTVDGTKLLALGRNDGRVLWQSSLADKLVSGCLDCFLLLDNMLVARVQGGTVQSFDAQTGKFLWSKRLNFETGGRLMPTGRQLIVFDRTQDNRNSLMQVVNPTNGETVAEITVPECSGQFFDLSHPLLYDTQRNQLYLISGDIIGPACLQVWDFATQQMVRQLVFDGLSLPSAFGQHIDQQPKALLAGDQLYFAAKQGSSGNSPGLLVQVNVTDGTWQALAPSPDYELAPLAVRDNLLLVRAIRTRGTEHSELWGLDPASGKSRWQYVLQASRWFEEPGSESAWDWHLTPQGVAVLQIFDNPDQLTVETLILQTGVSSGQKIIPLDDNYFTDIAWTDDAAWVALRKIQKVDLPTGTVTYTWP